MAEMSDLERLVWASLGSESSEGEVAANVAWPSPDSEFPKGVSFRHVVDSLLEADLDLDASVSSFSASSKDAGNSTPSSSSPSSGTNL